MMIIQSQAFDEFVMDNFTADPGELRTQLLTAAFPLGCIRATSLRQQWALDFKSIELPAFVTAADITCDGRACCREVLTKNPDKTLCHEDLLGAIAAVRARNPTLHDVVCGHDATAILALVSGPALGNALTANEVEQQLAEYFEPAHFALTSTFQECGEWERRNVPYVVNL
jgi:hypothetical protein